MNRKPNLKRAGQRSVEGNSTRPAELDEGWTYVKSQTSSVTTAWGVKWDEDAVARDLMQNFFDANRKDLGAVRVVTGGKVVEVIAPAAFNLERLFYLGSEKGGEDVGKYGEGFKAASLCLIRDHGVEPVVISGSSAVRIRVSGQVVDGTELVPLVYDFYQHQKGTQGTRLLMTRVGQKLAAAMREGLDHFFHDRHPRVGRHLWASHRGDVALYESTHPTEGFIFYRKLKRGTIDGIPVIVVIDKEFSTIEKWTKQDRDRLAFGDKLLEAFYKAFAKAVGRHDHGPRVAVLERSKALWQEGHPLIRTLCENLWGDQILDAASLDRLFGKGQYFAGYPKQHIQRDDFLQITATEERWIKEGRKRLPFYFDRLGVENAIKHIDRERKQEMLKARRRLTPAEANAVQVLKAISREFAPEIMQFFDGYKGEGSRAERRDRVTYSIANDPEILGAFNRTRHYSSTEVCLVGEVFVSEFPEAIATFLHEHAHIFGYDGSRAFTDALTHIIETIIRLRAGLDRYEKEWDQAKQKVLKERSGAATNTGAGATIEERLAAMDDQSLRDLLAKIPAGVMRVVLDSTTKKEIGAEGGE